MEFDDCLSYHRKKCNQISIHMPGIGLLIYAFGFKTNNLRILYGKTDDRVVSVNIGYELLY